jgi:hypothetical protein
MSPMLDRDAIRGLIRDVITEEVGRLRQGNASKDAEAAPVRVASDADLADFARRVLLLARDPSVRAAIEAGRHAFRLAGPQGIDGKSTPDRSHRVDSGVVTEEAMARLPQGVTRLVLAAGVSITPLARDKARALGVSVERIGR